MNEYDLRLEVRGARNPKSIINGLKQAIGLLEDGIGSISSCGADGGFIEVDFDMFKEDKPLQEFNFKTEGEDNET